MYSDSIFLITHKTSKQCLNPYYSGWCIPIASSRLLRIILFSLNPYYSGWCIPICNGANSSFAPSSQSLLFWMMYSDHLLQVTSTRSQLSLNPYYSGWCIPITLTLLYVYYWLRSQSLLFWMMYSDEQAINYNEFASQSLLFWMMYSDQSQLMPNGISRVSILIILDDVFRSYDESVFTVHEDESQSLLFWMMYSD